MHIPKTAGTSFRNILESAYGKSHVARFDMRDSHAYLNERRYPGRRLPNKRVLHGHFKVARLADRFELPTDVQVITWVRDPVDRVISNYNYLSAQLRSAIKPGSKHNPSSRILRTLIEFARDSRCRNRQYRYLRGWPLEGFAFIGVQEYYAEEVVEAARVLGWKSVPPVPRSNVTKSRTTDIPVDWLEEIRELNAKDIELYEACLRMREARIAKSAATA